MRRLMIGCVHIYRFFSPVKLLLFGPYCRCRFTPTCSEFALRVLKKYSLAKACGLILQRLARCHPFYHK
ncbi:MAG: membrane protein insertion efficiency factor YidD [Opitutales bacterium]|nr:membrane protein insertion efficiency factor YidD [Opitutales bacterium]